MKTAAERRHLNAYCPTHAIRFSVAARDGAIGCDAAPHLLVENYPASSSGQFLELCTVCDTVWPFSPTAPSAQCPHCLTSFDERSLCRRCSVFTLGSAATSRMRCGGCGEVRMAEQIHFCGEVGLFSSSREECPFCTQPVAPVLHVIEPANPPRANKPVAVRATIVEPAPPPAEAAEVVSTSTGAPAPASRVALWWGLGALAAAIVLVVMSSAGSFLKKLDRALDAGHYFAPAGESVYDIYMAEANANPASATVAAAAKKIVAKLGPEADRNLRAFYKDSRMDLGWKALERYYGFLATLAPNDVAYKVRNSYAEGQRHLLDERDYRAAYKCYRRALAYDGSFVLALNGIAKLYMQDSSPFHDEREAVRFYEQATAADPNFTWALKNLGEYYLQREDWPRAESYMNRALETSPNRPSILAALGRISYRRRHFAAARDYYTRARQYASSADEARRYDAALAEVGERLR